MQDVSHFTAVQAVVSRAVTVTRFIRDHLALFDEFKRLQQGVREAGMRARILVLPVPTRWYSVHACMRNVLNSQEILEKNSLLALVSRRLETAIVEPHQSEKSYATLLDRSVTMASGAV